MFRNIGLAHSVLVRDHCKIIIMSSQHSKELLILYTNLMTQKAGL